MTNPDPALVERVALKIMRRAEQGASMKDMARDAIAETLAALRESGRLVEWWSIEEAEKDGVAILLSRGRSIDIGEWHEDRYAAHPRPYWGGLLALIRGKTWARGNEPDAWMPLPDPPATAATGRGE